MKIKTDTPVEISQTSATINLNDFPQPRIVGFEEIIYDKIIELEEQVKIMNKKLDKLSGEQE
jgi:hypothetical protein